MLAIPNAGNQTLASMEPADARQNLERFRELVLNDPRLHDELRRTPDLESFAARAVELGRDYGCEFTAQTVRSAEQEMRRVWLERWI